VPSPPPPFPPLLPPPTPAAASMRSFWSSPLSVSSRWVRQAGGYVNQNLTSRELPGGARGLVATGRIRRGAGRPLRPLPPPSLLLTGHAASLTPSSSDTLRPSPRTNRTRSPASRVEIAACSACPPCPATLQKRRSARGHLRNARGARVPARRQRGSLAAAAARVPAHARTRLSLGGSLP
jgi:hypothetical protein